MRHVTGRGGLIAAMLCSLVTQAAEPNYAWRYYRPGNTGIQGDFCEAILIAPDGNPWIGGYDPSFEEGGFSKYLQAEERWVNFSNVDLPSIGHPELTGTVRVSDMELDPQGRMWIATWRGALRFDPAVGASSLLNFGAAYSPVREGGCRDLDIAPDGTIWFALLGFGDALGGVAQYTPSTGAWRYWTGGTPPIGGNNWPSLIWAVRGIEILPKPGGYTVWADAENNSGYTVFDSTTQLWETSTFSFTPGSVLTLLGKDCADDAGNIWAMRFVQFGGGGGALYSVDYRQTDGTWVTPPPIPGGAAEAFQAFGNGQALAVDGAGRVWRFNGSTWSDYGVWRPGNFTSDVCEDSAGNVWACGIGGAARRDVLTGLWQRYRITNTSQYDVFNADLAVAPDGGLYACANAGPGFGGMVYFDGVRWIGFNNAHYGLGVDWPFPTDNSQAVYYRPSNGGVAVNPSFNGAYEFDGATWTPHPGGSSDVVGFAEDSIGRLWGLGEYFSLGTYDASGFTNYSIAAWGQRIVPDPDRAGTVWANAGYEFVRTDGSYRFSRTVDDFPELTSQSDTFWSIAADRDGVAWLGCSVMLGAGGGGGGLVRLDSNTGTYSMMTHDGGWPLPGRYVMPHVVTPDGRVWMTYVNTYQFFDGGLCWYDGTNVGVFPGPVDGAPQWGGLPHTQVAEIEVREIPNGYELWMICLSRGIAVLTVEYPAVTPGDMNCDGAVTVSDIAGFVLALTNQAGYAAQYPDCDMLAGDANGDGQVTVSDIGAFVALVAN